MPSLWKNRASVAHGVRGPGGADLMSARRVRMEARVSTGPGW
jgi:hypothetical protein